MMACTNKSEHIKTISTLFELKIIKFFAQLLNVTKILNPPKNNHVTKIISSVIFCAGFFILISLATCRYRVGIEIATLVKCRPRCSCCEYQKF
jgi:hypothetical protein